MDTVYLNSAYLDADKANISVYDRGFLFADAVYEFIPVYHGKLHCEAEHLARLNRSLNAVQMENPISKSEWHTIFETLLDKNNRSTGHSGLYIQVSRGTDIPRKHDIPEKYTPTVLVISQALHTLPDEVIESGLTAVTLDDTRHKNCYMKVTNLLPNILLHKAAQDAGADEAILIRDGNALESTSSNLFIVKDGELITPPTDHQILGGITRQFVIELAEAENIPVKEQDIKKADLFKADEIWITSSSRKLHPIVLLDQEKVGTGKPGPVWEKMINRYNRALT